MTGSVSFDRAASYYDITRGLSPDGTARMTAALADAFGRDGPILEVGVGTGQVAVPLRAAGVEVVGVDLSRPMLVELRAKDLDRDVPILEADATRMPFGEAVFAGSYLRWVLHLIPDWRAAVDEIVRVTRPGSPFLAALGSYGGVTAEIQAHFASIAGVSLQPAGLTWEGWALLDEHLEAAGAAKLPDVTIDSEHRDDVETFVRGIEGNRYSWTWAVTDEDLRARAAASCRSWAEERWGPLERIPRESVELRFAAYRLA